MEILYTADEKYLQAVEELSYGELPKALHLFNEIIDSNPDYARAHFQLGYCYFYEFKNYQTAGYHLKKCMDTDPLFPDSYIHYLRLLILLKMSKTITLTTEKALQIPGVVHAELYELLGNNAEQEQDFTAAAEFYKKAMLATTTPAGYGTFQEHMKRVTAKQNLKAKIIYAYNEE